MRRPGRRSRLSTGVEFDKSSPAWIDGRVCCGIGAMTVGPICPAFRLGVGGASVAGRPVNSVDRSKALKYTCWAGGGRDIPGRGAL